MVTIVVKTQKEFDELPENFKEFTFVEIRSDNDLTIVVKKTPGNSTVTAYDNSAVWACDSSTVKAYDSSTVKAFDSSTVWACDSSTVVDFRVAAALVGKDLNAGIVDGLRMAIGLCGLCLGDGKANWGACEACFPIRQRLKELE